MSMLAPELAPFGEDLEQVLPIGALRERRGEACELLVVDEPHPPRDLFRARDLEILTALDDLDERRGLEQGLVRPAVEPCRAAAHAHDAEGALREVELVDVRDLVFTT